MGLDATLARIKFKVNSDLEYEEIRLKKWTEFNKDHKLFDDWSNNVWEEILYTSNWEIARLISSRNIGDKKVDFNENRDVILDKEDIEIIIKLMKSTKENINYKDLEKDFNKYIHILENCLKTTDFEKETLLYGEWF